MQSQVFRIPASAGMHDKSASSGATLELPKGFFAEIEILRAPPLTVTLQLNNPSHLLATSKNGTV